MLSSPREFSVPAGALRSILSWGLFLGMGGSPVLLLGWMRDLGAGRGKKWLGEGIRPTLRGKTGKIPERLVVD